MRYHLLREKMQISIEHGCSRVDKSGTNATLSTGFRSAVKITGSLSLKNCF